MNVTRIVNSFLSFNTSHLFNHNTSQYQPSVAPAPLTDMHHSIHDNLNRGSRFLESIEECSDVETSPDNIRIFHLDTGDLQRFFSSLDIKQMGNSSIPNIYTNVTEFDEVAQNDISNDRRVLAELYEAIGSIPGLIRGEFISSTTLRTIRFDAFYEHGPTEPCEYLGDCYGDDVPYGPFHALNSHQIMRNVLRDYLGRVDFYADEISTCWLTLAALLRSLDKTAEYMRENPDAPTIVVIPAGTGVADALDDQVNCNPYQSVVERVQSLLDINNNTKIFAAAGTKPEILNSLGAAIVADELRDLLDISNSCLTPANDPNVYAIAAVNSNDECSELTWPSKGNDNADFAYIPDPLGRHVEDGENSSSGAVTHFAAQYVIFLTKVLEFLPEGAEDEMMDAVFATLRPFPSGSDSDGCGAGIADLDAAFDYLVDFYGVTLPTPSPTTQPTNVPTVSPTSRPTTEPTMAPSLRPTRSPSASPTASPSVRPSLRPTMAPSVSPSVSPTASPTEFPSPYPTTAEPSKPPTNTPLGTDSPQAPVSVPAPSSANSAFAGSALAVSSMSLLLSAFFARELLLN